MRSFALASLLASTLLAACGGGKHPTTIGSSGGGGAVHGPVMVFIGLADDKMFEAACHDCDALRAQLDGRTVGSGHDLFQITGTVSDECDASGPTDVIGVERLSGDPEKSPLAIAVLPADAPIDLQEYSSDPPAAPDPALRDVLVRRALADLADQDAGIDSDSLVIEQVLQVNVAGDARPDTLIAANVPQTEDEGPGYTWSALVMLPGGDREHAVTLWKSDLEHLHVDGSFDLEGDGTRELLYSAEYYEGGGRGAAAVTNDQLDFLGTWGCGA